MDGTLRMDAGNEPRTRSVRATRGENRRDSATRWLILAAALIAVLGTRPYAGGWNDGSRLAMVESLVDYGSLAIDHSIFLAVPDGGPSPYLDDISGTQDKLFIDGHWYSDKSPLPGLFMALVYWLTQAVTGLAARENPGAFCYGMALTSSGVAYVVAVASIDRLGRAIKLRGRTRWLFTASFALATTTLVYSQQVNNHIVLLALTALLTLQLVRLAQETQGSVYSRRRLALIGTLAGLAYGTDLGVGPPLLAATGVLVCWRVRRPAALMFLAGALPWLGLHHAVNWAVGGTLAPANAVPEYLAWPGSPFSATTMTGQVNHETSLDGISYLIKMLFGKRGFLLHNLPLLLLLPLGWAALRRRWFTPQEMRPQTVFMPEGTWAIAWCVLGFLVYGVSSNNYSGACLSVRWFVPFLAPCYFLIAVGLRCEAWVTPGFALMSVGGTVLMASAWGYGPWILHSVPGYWFVVGATLAGLLALHITQTRGSSVAPPDPRIVHARVAVPQPLPAASVASEEASVR